MKFGQILGEAKLLGEIQGEVKKVNLVLEEIARSQVALVEQVSLHTLRAGGKRLRPALVSLASRATGLPYSPERAHKLGATMELIHMATLIHDDVIDHASLRRGLPTANSVFGNTASILSGDVLLSKAMAVLAEDGNLEIIRNVSRAVVDLAEGEVLELQLRGEFNLDEAKHFEVLRLKTATFIQSCCEVGAIVADAPTNQVRAIGEYGLNIGYAFQVVDDLLDYRGDQAETGKPVATDFREGCATLPLIYLRDHLIPSEREVVESKFGKEVSEEEIRMICGWMDKRGAFSRAEQKAEELVDKAVKALEPLPNSYEKDLLTSVAAYVLGRKN